jgi:hypothetical protein
MPTPNVENLSPVQMNIILNKNQIKMKSKESKGIPKILLFIKAKS